KRLYLEPDTFRITPVTRSHNCDVLGTRARKCFVEALRQATIGLMAIDSEPAVTEFSDLALKSGPRGVGGGIVPNDRFEVFVRLVRDRSQRGIYCVGPIVVGRQDRHR